MIKLKLKEAPSLFKGVFRQAQKLELSLPYFISYNLNLKELKEKLKPFDKLGKLIVIGNGGSINSFQAYKRAFINQKLKPSFILSTPEPDLIHHLQANFKPPETLVMAISKSGNTLETIESLLTFKDYKIITVTTRDQGLLSQLAKTKNWPIINHPEISGRFSSFTESGIAPSLFVGIKAELLTLGGKIFYQTAQTNQNSNNNLALKLAAFLKSLEEIKRPEIFFPIYSYFLEGFSTFILQILHETVGKDGKGPTCLAFLGPEWQHHTAQRFFGGRKTVGGVFITVKNSQKDLKIEIPESLEGFSFSSLKLGNLNQLSYQRSINFEAEANMEEAVAKKIPIAHIEIDKIEEKSIGEFTAFWHLVAYYLALLWRVDPFTEPAVENAKKLTFQKLEKVNKI